MFKGISMSQTNQNKNGSAIVQLAFEATATVHQEIELLNGISELELVEGLQRGVYATTMGHEKGNEPAITRIADDVVVARIVSQSVDGEYQDYR